MLSNCGGYSSERAIGSPVRLGTRWWRALVLDLVGQEHLMEIATKLKELNIS
jgi:hypothetical protein